MPSNVCDSVAQRDSYIRCAARSTSEELAEGGGVVVAGERDQLCLGGFPPRRAEFGEAAEDVGGVPVGDVAGGERVGDQRVADQ
jgi:hypothetical protein